MLTVFLEEQDTLVQKNPSFLLNLRELSQSVPNTEYNPEKYTAVYMLIEITMAIAIIYATGNMVVIGDALGKLSARLAARKFTRIEQKNGYESTKFKISRQLILLQRSKQAFRLELNV